MGSRSKKLSIYDNLFIIFLCVIVAFAFSSCSGKDKEITVQIDGEMKRVQVSNFKIQPRKDRIYFCLDGKCMYYNGPYIIED